MDIKKLSGSSNKTYKKIKSLKNKKYRDIYGIYIAEGFNLVKEAVRNNVRIDALFFDELTFNTQKEKYLNIINSINLKEDINAYILDNKMFNEISDTVNSQGILAVIPKPQNNISEIIFETNGLYLLLDGLQDPGNMGTIIRSAQAAGFNAIIAGKDCVDIYNPKTVRSAMGSVFRMPVYDNIDLTNIIEKFKLKGINVYASVVEKGRPIYETDIKNCGIVIGNEARGISEEVKSICTGRIYVPMPGKAESINAACAASVIIFEAVRQKNI